MITLRLTLVWLVVSMGLTHAAVPTFQSFESTQFDTNLLSIKYRSDWTNEVGVIHPATVNTEVTVTNLNLYETFVLPAKVVLLTLGTNELNVATNSTWLLFSPTNDSAQVTLSLSSGKYQGQLLFITSQNGDGAFNLPDGSEQYDVPGALVDLQGNWVGTTNRGIILQYTAPDWIEMARFEPSSTNGAFGIAINPTDGVLPYRSGTNSFGDSPISRVDSDSVLVAGDLSIGSITNTLFRSTDGSTLTYTNGSNNVGFRVTNGNNKSAVLSAGSGGHVHIISDTGQDVRMEPNGATQAYIASSANFRPGSNGSLDLGSGNTQWNDIYLDRNIVWNGTTNSLVDTWGSGSPETVVTASPGSIYRDGANGNIYKKASGTGNTGWSDLSGGGGGSTIWTNVSGTIQPLIGQTTNRLSFTSGAADGATANILELGTTTTWANDDALLIRARNNTTNIFVVSADSGGIWSGRFGLDPNGAFSYPNPSSSFVSLRSPAWGDPSQNNVNVGVIDSDSFNYHSQLTILHSIANPAAPIASLRIESSGNVDPAGFIDLVATTGSEQIVVGRSGTDYVSLKPRTASTGSAVAHFLDTSNVLTNGDSILMARNTGSTRFNVDGNSGYTGAGTLALMDNGKYLDPATTTNTFQNKTLDASATGNVVKLKSYIQLIHPHRADGTGAVISTDSTQSYYGHALFSGTAATNANFIEYRLAVPEDLDTAVDLKVSRWKVRLNAADTSASTYTIGMASVADSGSTDSPTLGQYVTMTVAADASGASGDVETASNITLTGWRTNMTAGQLWVIRVARDGGDASTVEHYDMGITIEYSAIQ